MSLNIPLPLDLPSKLTGGYKGDWMEHNQIDTSLSALEMDTSSFLTIISGQWTTNHFQDELLTNMK